MLQGVYFESTGVQGEGAYRKLHITMYFKCRLVISIKTTVCLEKQIQQKMVAGVLEIHQSCFTLPLVEKASSLLLYLWHLGRNWQLLQYNLDLLVNGFARSLS